jgi:PAS domain S-box-containing protein
MSTAASLRLLDFRSIVERSSDAVVLIQADGTASYFSPSMERLLGFPASELVSRREMTQVLPEDRARSLRAYQEVLAAPGAEVRFEFRVSTRDGALRWLECAATNCLEEPALRCVVALYRDITDRKRAEARLVQTEERLRYLLSATRAVTYTCQCSDPFAATFISENVVAMTGYAAGEFLASPSFWMDRVHPDDLPPMLADLPRVFVEGALEHEYRFRHADGRYRWMHDALSVVFDDAGQPREFIGHWVDITERKESEAALRRSEETFRTLIQHHPTAMLVHREGRITHTNGAMVKLLGYPSAEELCRQAPMDLVLPQDQAFVRSRMDLSRRTGHAPPAEQHLLRRDGSTVAVEVESLVLEIGEATAAVVFFRDLTERRELLARMAETDRMSSAGMIAAGVAHELNNPLAYLISNLTLLSDAVPVLLRGGGEAGSRLRASEVPRVLGDAQEAASRMASVVRDLRALSHADTSDFGPTDVVAALRSAAKLANNVIRHSAGLQEEFEADVPRVHASEGRLVQVFLNLLVNAAEAIPEGAPERNRITLRVRREPEARLRVDLEDTGVGIPAEILPRIFDPFFTTKRAGQGTGLGLSICQGLVRAFGGEIQVSSQVGQGTRVTLWLTEARAAGVDAAPGPRAADTDAACRGRVLLVDDEVRFGRSLTLLLAPEYQVTPLTDAREALRRLAAGERFEVILCDLMMPGMSGMEFHAELHRLSPALAEKVVFLTGGAVTRGSRDFLASTRNLCLEKPVKPETLCATLDAVIAGRSNPPRG